MTTLFFIIALMLCLTALALFIAAVVTRTRTKAEERETEFFHASVETLPNPVFYKDAMGIYRYCNQAFADYFELPKKAIIGKSSFDIASKEIANVYRQRDLEAIADECAVSYEGMVQGAKGALRRVMFYKTPVLLKGVLKGIVGVIFDLTEMLEREERIREEQERLFTITEASFDAIVLFEEHGVVSFANRAVETIFGYEPSELHNRDLASLVFEDSVQAEFMDALKKAHHHGGADARVEIRELTAQKKDGAGSTVEVTLSPAIIEGTRYTVGVFRDSTARKALEASWRRSSFIVNASKETMALVNREYEYEMVNRAYAASYRLPAEAFVGQHLGVYIRKDIFETIMKPHLDYSFLGQEITVQERIPYGNRGVRYIEMNFYPYRDEDDNITHVAIVARDISSRKYAEEALNKYVANIESTLREKVKSIERAQVVQRDLNTRDLPAVKALKILAYYMPSRELGGDYFDIRTAGNNLIIIMADCTGHGIEAAMAATLIKAVSDRHYWLLAEMEMPNTFLQHVNQDLTKYSAEDQFPTMFVCLIDTHTMEIRYANANGELPFLVANGEAKQLPRIRGMHLGFDLNHDFELGYAKIGLGETLVLYSDAASEITEPNGELFLKDDLRNTLSAFGDDPNANLSFLLDTLKAHNGRRFPLKDDLTLMMLTHLGETTETFALSSYAELSAVRGQLQKTLERYGFGYDAREKFIVALYELIENAITHGNKNDTTKSVRVTYTINCEQASASIKDEGEGFTPDAVPDPTNAETLEKLMKEGNEEKISHGRGIWLAKKYVDTVEYSEDGTRVTIMKERGPSETIFHFTRWD